MAGQGHFHKPIKIFGRSYLPFINGGTNLNDRSLLTSMTVCIESCGTGDISSSIVTVELGHMVGTIFLTSQNQCETSTIFIGQTVTLTSPT